MLITVHIRFVHFFGMLKKEKYLHKGSREAASEGPIILHIHFRSLSNNPISNWGHQSRRDNSIPYMGVWYIYRDTQQPQEKETS